MSKDQDRINELEVLLKKALAPGWGCMSDVRDFQEWVRDALQGCDEHQGGTQASLKENLCSELS